MGFRKRDTRRSGSGEVSPAETERLEGKLPCRDTARKLRLGRLASQCPCRLNRESHMVSEAQRARALEVVDSIVQGPNLF